MSLPALRDLIEDWRRERTRDTSSPRFDKQSALIPPFFPGPISANMTATHSSPSLSPSTPQNTHVAMAPISQQRVDASNLMSPPEPAALDNFHITGDKAAVQHRGAEKRQFPHPPLSPPISPYATSATIPSHPVDAGIAMRDPILYPNLGGTPSPQAPLFSPRAESVETNRVLDEHIASRPTSLFRQTTPPKRVDYELTLLFKSDVMRMYSQDPRGWLRKERELLRVDREDRKTMVRGPKLAPILASNKTTGASAKAAINSLRPPKATTASKPATTRGTTTTNNNNNPPNRVQKPRAPRTKHTQIIRSAPTPSPAMQLIRYGCSMTPEPRPRVIAPNREDKNFEALVDLCPPLSSLPNKPNSLKVDWKGNALDLSKDPMAHLLHPDELALAGGLRLDCATYLTSKRRIFIRRLECAEIRKEFRKTDAQQACKIDVNKASKLWQAYDKVGWLDLKWVQPFMKQNLPQ